MRRLQILDRADLMAHFVQGNGAFHCARWNRPLELAVLSPFETMTLTFEDAFGRALERVCAWSGQSWRMQTGTRPPNLIFVFVQKWADLATVSLDLFGPLAIPKLIEQLTIAGATQFRTFSYGEDGSLASAVGFYNMSSRIKDYPTNRIAMAQSILTHANFGLGALRVPIVAFDGAEWKPSRDIKLVLQATYAEGTPVSMHNSEGVEELYQTYSELDARAAS